MLGILAVLGLSLFGLVVALLAALTARRGKVCHPEDGYEHVPQRVRDDPVLAERANEEVGRHALLAMLLCAGPLGYATWMLARSGEHVIPTFVLAGLAVYGALIAVVVILPFERMKHW